MARARYWRANYFQARYFKAVGSNAVPISDIDPALLVALLANGGWPVFLVRIELDSETLYLGGGFIGSVENTFASETYVGLGEIGNISFAEEKINAMAQSILYLLSGIDPSTSTAFPGFREALGDTLEEPVRGRRIDLFLAALDQAMQLVGEPLRLRSDIGAALSLIDSGDKLELQLKASPKSHDYRRHRRRMFSYADWRNLHPASSLMDDDTWRRRNAPWGQRNEED